MAANNYKFLHIDVDRQDHVLREMKQTPDGPMLGPDKPLICGGYYNWHRVFDGDFKLYDEVKGKIADYDIVFAGLTTWDLKAGLATKIRQEIEGTKTSLIVHTDYAVESWAGAYTPQLLRSELLQADYIFAADESSVSYLRALVDDQVPINFLQHPTDVEKYKKFTIAPAARDNDIVALLHMYDRNWLPVHLIGEHLPWPIYLVAPNNVLRDLASQIRPYFPRLMPGGDDFNRYISFVARRKVALDTYHHVHSYGRFAVDNACIKLPTVGTDIVWSQKFLWPDLTTQTGDVFAQRELIKRLFADQEFYDHCTAYALDKVQTLSYENRKTALLELINAENKVHA